MRIGYDNQNGREYVAIGRLLRERGVLPPGGASMQAIVDWMRANPDQGRALMRENLSYIFFKELTGPGPLGAMGLPVTPQATVAADPLFVPLGAPVFLTMERPEAKKHNQKRRRLKRRRRHCRARRSQARHVPGRHSMARGTRSSSPAPSNPTASSICTA
jgi:membrane-bound lytic murein transglycosylase